MTIISKASSRPTPGVPEQYATRAAFFIAGFGMAAWAPLIAYAKIRLNIDNDALGALLLCFGMGSILAMPISGLLAARLGCRIVLHIAALVVCVALPFLAVIESYWFLGAVLFAFGGGVGVIDVVINIQAIIVEKASKRTMMSGFHGFFSLGGLIGSGGTGALLAWGYSPLGAVCFVIGFILFLLALTGRYLLPYGSEGSAPLFVVPKGLVIFIGILCFITFLVEGAILDWSAVFLTDIRQVPLKYTGFGYAVFSITMAFGRLTGDQIVRKIGGAMTLIAGGLCVITGLLLAVLAPYSIAAFTGFGLVGIGASNIVPVLYSATGRQTVMPVHLAVVAVSCLGYAGILVGPAAIGFVAKLVSLEFAFLGLAGLMLIVTLSFRVAKS